LPNIVFILCDDLGPGDLGCYGQTRIRTPNIDRLAAAGVRLTTHYSGNNVCAPSRCVLMTGLHPGHAFIRDNRGGLRTGVEGQEPVPAGELKFPLTLKRLGYVLGGFGKWGLGPVGSTGDPNQQGFDRFFGYNCQAVAHNFYPTYLWDNQTKVPLDNPDFSAHQKFPADGDPSDRSQYRRYLGTTYAPDRIHAEALNFLAEHRERPFFLYYPTTIPHLALQVPDESLAEYVGKFPESPYLGGQGYVPHMTPRAAYAAMVTHLDRQIGELLDAVNAYGLDEETIVVLTSDNGPAPQGIGGTDSAFFESALGSRGLKGSNYEGGLRVPGLVRWTGHIAAGHVVDRVTGFEDWFPTLLELAGQAGAIPAGLDGISFAPTLRGESQAERPFLYREIPGNGGQQSIRVGSWKAIRTNLNRPTKNTPPGSGAVELYDLAADPGETRNLAAEHPDKVAELTRLMAAQHRPSTLFPIRLLDAPPTP
jgi:arylsulfatase A-like enzyme